jgi:tetratricopeptide (TPR) repeat protein
MKGNEVRRPHKWRITVVFLLALLIQSTSGAHEDDLVEAQHLNEQVLQYYAKGQYQQAIPLAQHVLLIREKVFGTENPDTAQSLNNLAALYRASGAYAKAEPLYQRALAINEKLLGADDPNTAGSLNNLALLYRTTAAYAKAEPLYQRALAIYEKALGPKHPDTARALRRFSIVLCPGSPVSVVCMGGRDGVGQRGGNPECA